ncbi:histidine kinase [Kineosporia rhizophila]|uniref:sensor histidine kinase n=1 Tax=Kineosporia rhizophila TaxID=84633 RepID=UPI001E2DF3C5|nr:histidine kinase [Kineosporia rhizophila]MCE0538122.1 histidine kinase [Kineosporia rhizophila]
MTDAALRWTTGWQFPAPARPWRGSAYAATTAVTSSVLWLLLAIPLTPVISAVVVLSTRPTGAYLIVSAGLLLIGLGLLASLGPRLALTVARAEQWRLRLLDGAPLPHRGHSTHLWRAVAHLVLVGFLAPIWLGALAVLALIVVTTPLSVEHWISDVGSLTGVLVRTTGGLLLIPVLLYLTPLFGSGHAALTRKLLEPEPSEDLVEVARSRARLAHAFDAERQRIERDLHDIAQQRLVALTMQIGLARLDLPGSSPAAAAMSAAHEQARTLMTELRDLIRGISPRTLRELGLLAAVEELAAASSLDVHVDVTPGRYCAEVETAAFAAISEALANATKHTDSTQISITARPEAGQLLIEVRDSGQGGADPTRGSGITGLADRAAAAGGRLLMSSPAGGPTVVRVELPCAS